MVEWEGIPEVEADGDRISLSRDVIPLKNLAAKERLVRRKMDPYQEAYYLLLEKAEAKWR
jgi:hypothetical protein